MLEIVLAVWIVVALIYIAHTPIKHRSHDFLGHLDYTASIAELGKIPEPSYSWETFQPPLYYLICNLLSPPTASSDVARAAAHINYVVYLSILLGAITLLIIYWLVKQVTNNTLVQLLVLLFIATTPMYVFLFSTYNNDSLSTLLIIATLAISYRLFTNWSVGFAILLFFVVMAGMYTKNLIIVPVLIIIGIYCKSLIRLKAPEKNHQKIILVLLLALFSFLPWAYFHNFHYTGKFFPTNVDEKINKEFDINHFKNLIGILFRVPELQFTKPDYSHEWDVPWVQPSWEEVPPSTKRYDYFAFSFVTSVIGEYKFTKPDVIFIWILLFIHLVVIVLSLPMIFRSGFARTAFLFILLAHLAQISAITMFPDLPQRAMNYRYVSWTWAPWAILYANALEGRNNIISKLLTLALVVGIIIQIYVLATVEGGYW